jgi:hypothetical protein
MSGRIGIEKMHLPGKLGPAHSLISWAALRLSEVGGLAQIGILFVLHMNG